MILFSKVEKWKTLVIFFHVNLISPSPSIPSKSLESYLHGTNSALGDLQAAMDTALTNPNRRRIEAMRLNIEQARGRMMRHKAF